MIKHPFRQKAIDNQPEDIKRLAKFIRTRLRIDKDLVIAVTGGEGEGKTTFTTILAFLVDEGFLLTTNMSMIPNPQEIKEEFTALPQYAFYLIDEAIRSLHKHKWHDTLQQTITQLYATERWQNKCTALLIPNFQDLTKSFRDYRVMLRIHVWERGFAMAYIKDFDKDATDPWHIDETIMFKKKVFKSRPLSQRDRNKVYEIERKTINYFMDLHWVDLPEEIKEEYRELKIKSREIYVERSDPVLDGKTDLDKRRMQAIYNLILEVKNCRPGIMQKEIAAISGLNENTIRGLIQRFETTPLKVNDSLEYKENRAEDEISPL